MPGTTNYPAALDSQSSPGSAIGFYEPKNLQGGLVGATLTAAGTTLTVNFNPSARSYPTAGILSIGPEAGPWEVVTYTGITTSTFTGLTRGLNGTTAVQHEINEVVAMAPVAAHFSDMAAAIVATQTKLGTDTSPARLGVVAFGSLPSAGTQGRIARVSDRFRGLYLDTGSQWVHLGGQVINVLEHGLKNDNSTDNATALQALFDDTTNVPNGSVLYFPDGSYRFGAAVNLNRSLTIQGASYTGTFFIPNAGTTTLDFLRVNVGGTNLIYNVQFRDFSIYPLTDRTGGAALYLGAVGHATIENVKIGNSLGGRPYYGVRCERLSDSVFSNVKIQACASNGVHMSPPSGGTAGNKHLIVEVYFMSGCEIFSCLGHGMYLEENNDYDSNNNSLEGIHLDSVSFFGNTGDAIRLHTGAATAKISNVHLINPSLDTSGGNGLNVTGTGEVRNLIIQDVWVSANTGVGIILNSTVIDYEISNGYVILNGLEGISVGSAVRGRIHNLHMFNNSASAGGSYAIDLGGTAQYLSISDCRLYNTNRTASGVWQNGIRIGASCNDIELANLYLVTGGSTTPLTDNSGTSSRVRKSNLILDSTTLLASNVGLMVDTLGNGGARDALRVRDTTANESKYLRVSGNNLQIIDNAFGAVIFTLTDAGALTLGAIAGDAISPSNGGHWYNSAQQAHRFRSPVGNQGLVGLVYSSTTPSSAISSTITETNFSLNFPLPALSLAVNKVIRITARGVYGTHSSAPTLIMRVKAGTTVLGVTPTWTTVASTANRGWEVQSNIHCVTTGITGTVEAQGMFRASTGAAGAVTNAHLDMPNTGTITLDTTAAQTLQLSAQWGTSNANNSITMRQLLIEVLN